MNTADVDVMLPPRDGAVKAVTVGVAATAAATVAATEVLGPLTGGPGPAYYVFEATGGDIAIVFGATSGMGAPALSGVSKNSGTIPQGQTRGYWLTPNDLYYRAIATVAACTLAYWRSSP